MQLIDDDMDELFRNAAEHYPLRTDGADWNAVLGRLQPEGEIQPAADSAGSRYHRLLWLLLLTPLFFIAHLPRFTEKAGVIKGHTASPVVTVTSGKVHEKKSLLSVVPEATVPAVVSYQYKRERQKAISRQFDKKGERDDFGVPLMEDGKPVTIDDLLKQAEDSKHTAATADSQATSITLPVTGAMVDTAIAEEKIVLAKDSSSKADSTPVILAKKEKAKVTKGLYFGILASPDISTVKGQQVSKTGYGFGAIIGYRISKRIAVETGVLWDRKYYYSKGDYFSTKKLPASPSWDIIDVDGWCNMYELPLNVRYFFATGKKNSWYVNAGFSSYLMKKENYDYRYNRYGEIRTINWGYDNATRNWFNIIHAGIGYERPVGVLGTLRVEPYLKASVGGVGIGSLPLTSFGINVGITRSVKF